MKGWDLAFAIVEEVALVKRRTRRRGNVFPCPHILADNDFEVIPMSLGAVEIILVVGFVPEFPRLKPRLVVRDWDCAEKLKVLGVVIEHGCWKNRVMTNRE